MAIVRRGEIHTRARETRSSHVASLRNFARVRVYFARPTIDIAKIRDYSQFISRQLSWTLALSFVQV